MFKTPKPEKPALPFRSRREMLAEDKRRRNELFINRSLDAAQGFSWSRRPDEPRGLLARWRGVQLHQKVIALAALGIAAVLVLSFTSIASVGLEPQERLIFAESWSADRTAEDAIRDREAAVAELRAQIAAQEKAMAEYQAKLAAERAAAAAAGQPPPR